MELKSEHRSPTMTFVLMVLYGLVIFTVGLLRSVEAELFKPNAFYFCLVIAALSIVGAFLVRSGRQSAGLTLGLIGTFTAFAFYLWCFITKPEQDASLRVVIAIVASIGQLCVLATIALPRSVDFKR